MKTAGLSTPSEHDLILLDGTQFSRRSLLEQMNRLLESKHFCNSKRYPTFLRFVIEQTLQGNADHLKERALGTDVFSRPDDYDTNADPIVRVTAGEIRKRIAQYYQEPAHQDEIRIDLPLGAYIPHFSNPVQLLHRAKAHPRETKPTTLDQLRNFAELPAVQPAVVAAAPPAAVSAEVLPAPLLVPKKTLRERLLGTWTIIAACVVLAGVAAFWVRQRFANPAPGINYFWQATLKSPDPALIVIGVHSVGKNGREDGLVSHAAAADEQPEDMLSAMESSDMVPVSDIVSYSRLTDVLTRQAHIYTTLASTDASIEEIRRGPLILIGGLDNLWTLRIANHLRFRFRAEDQRASEIVDSQDPKTVWRFDNMQKVNGNTQDYAIVASYFDPTVERPVLIAAGVGKAGTEVASEFLTNDSLLRDWLQQKGQPSGKNVELVLSTDIIDGKTGPPHVVASQIW